MRVLALMAPAAALAAGCSSGGDPVPPAAAISQQTPAPPTPAPSGGHAHSLPTKIQNDPSVRKNVVQTKCAAVPGGWGAKGTATNPGEKPVTYKIVVHFTTTKATALDFAQTLVKVPPGKTVHWSAKKEFPAEKQMLCPMPGISVVS
ncbi:hypothetical protein Sru01_69600 [Sphaerisporangium rufum]|uniref:Uncharacterized protein n=1 Tax=Sphaerisporangium rufum TaxID=1381558 RepID=A0A919R9Z4_9ACTN|nr:hypothetical protein [Sphaerisporangium rufum]GII81978.1 hypothetical protein Sru01_69600 [Sphaerisporangium rufum]